jgi:PAS domain S-box-containing protein
MQRILRVPTYGTKHFVPAFFERLETRLSVIYGIIAILWIAFSDSLLALLSAHNQSLFTTISVLKGLGFVTLTTVALFAILSNELRKRRGVDQALQRDITERKYAEKSLRETEINYRRIVETAHEGIWVIDADNRTTFANSRMAEMLGYSVDELIGVPVFAFAYDEDREAVAQEMAKRREGITAQFEFKLQRKDSSVFWALMKANPFFNDEGYDTGALAMVSDVTEHKQAIEEHHQRERLEAELKKEKEIIELKERFISMVSHEFRTPLSVITLSCHMLEDYRDRLSPEQNLRKLHEILEQTHQMTELLEDVLTLGKARSGTPELSTVSLDLEALCRNLVEQLRLTDTVAHTITFISEGQFHNIWMDEKLIRHILVNLLSNAIKYSPNGGEVRLELCQQGNEVVFRIQDEGIGILMKTKSACLSHFTGRAIQAIFLAQGWD